MSDEKLTTQVGEDENQSDYSSHKQQIVDAQPDEARIEGLQAALLNAFCDHLIYKSVPYIRFGDLNAEELADAFISYPIVIKSTLACVNVAQRAIKRDLGFDFDTYGLKVTAERANIIAGYVKPLLPPEIAVPALMELDRYFWTDKEMRSAKGAWEKTVTTEIKRQACTNFVKRMFSASGHDFEIDAAYPASGPIKVAIDVKRIESPRDFHKRTDEIVNKSNKFKEVYSEGIFLAVVYYPFPSQHINLKGRLETPAIDSVFFAGQTHSSISFAVEALLSRVGMTNTSIAINTEDEH